MNKSNFTRVKSVRLNDRRIHCLHVKSEQSYGITDKPKNVLVEGLRSAIRIISGRENVRACFHTIRDLRHRQSSVSDETIECHGGLTKLNALAAPGH